MKFLIAFACLIASISAAVPEITQLNDEHARIVTGQIVQAINDVSQTIKDRGLDPFELKREARSFELPVPIIFSAAGFIEDILSTGLSDIRINRMNFSVLTSRLSFDLELPLIHISVGDAFGEATIFGEKVEAEISGSVDIRRIRVVGQVQVSIGIISGISVRSVTCDFTLDDIFSHLKVEVLGYNFSDDINTFLGDTIPQTLRTFRRDINRLIEIILFDIIDANL